MSLIILVLMMKCLIFLLVFKQDSYFNMNKKNTHKHECFLFMFYSYWILFCIAKATAKLGLIDNTLVITFFAFS